LRKKIPSLTIALKPTSTIIPATQQEAIPATPLAIMPTPKIKKTDEHAQQIAR
jgi:hypothetical protein